MGVGVSFLVLVCPTRLGGFVFKYGLPKGAGSFGLVLVCPTGPGVGGSFFLKYWSAQRDRGWEGCFFFKYWSAQRDRGGGGGGGSFFFLSTGLPNGFGGVFVFFQVLVRNATAVVDRGIQTLKKDLATRVARKGGQWSDHFERYNARPHETVHGAREDVEKQPATDLPSADERGEELQPSVRRRAAAGGRDRPQHGGP